jgi:hypothetical protein
MQDKMPKNKKSQAHGYWELYWDSDITLCYKGCFINNLEFGYWKKYTEQIYYAR